jgi:L-amino acid N-acyltransferase YncA
VPSWETWDKDHLSICRFVAEINNSIVGWAALSPVSSRCIYTGGAKASVYVTESARGKGIGNLLLTKLIADSEANDIWMLEAGIFPENTSSRALQKSCGFREVGYREKLGKLDGKWWDVIFFERRSKVIQ